MSAATDGGALVHAPRKLVREAVGELAGSDLLQELTGARPVGCGRTALHFDLDHHVLPDGAPR